MNIQLIGISHKTAPVQIRALFAFTDENKKELMTRICTQKEIRECVLLSTCNRTELYTVSEEDISVRSVMTAMQRIMLDMAGIGDAGEVGAFAVLSGNTGSAPFVLCGGGAGFNGFG